MPVPLIELFELDCMRRGRAKSGLQYRSNWSTRDGHVRGGCGTRGPVRKIKIKVFAIGRENERTIADFIKPWSELGRKRLIWTNYLSEIGPVQTIVPGRG